MELHRPRLVRLLAILLAPLSLFSQTHDYWIKAERRGIGYFYEHITVTRLPGGNLQYQSLSHAKTDVMGMNPEDIFRTGTYLTDSKFHPISFASEEKFQAKETCTGGVRKGSRMKVTVQSKGQPPETRSVALSHAYFNVFLYDLIARHRDQKSFRLKMFGASDSKPHWTYVEILSAGDSEIVALLKDPIQTIRCRIGRDGQLREMQLDEMSIRIYATDAKNAQNITYLSNADGANLVVHSRQGFPNVYNVRQALVRMRWKKLPFVEFNLQDNRQKVVSKNQSGEQFEAILQMTSATKPITDRAAPATQNPKYLGDDSYIKPHDSAIRKQAAVIIGETHDNAARVRNLLEWVTSNIQDDMIAETLTGPEVLAGKRGKCSEHAILFASLARALGIPTRLVLGVSGDGGEWVGHMWDEVWLGDWIAVDPTDGGFVSGPSHLKFVDSPTLEGLETVRIKLIDNLEIEILDFEEKGVPTSLKTGISGMTYTNAPFHCRISSPDKTWTLKEEPEDGTALSMKPSEGDIEFALVVFGVPAGSKSGKILDERLAAIGKMETSVKLIETGEVDVAGQKASRAVFSQSGEEGKTIVNENILLTDGTSGYLFVWIVPQEKFVGLAPVLKGILDSFESVKSPRK